MSKDRLADKSRNSSTFAAGIKIPLSEKKGRRSGTFLWAVSEARKKNSSTEKK